MALFHTTVLDNQIKALDTIGSVSGSIATFETDKAENLVNLEVAITATGGGGTPVSPIAINGFSACSLVVCGKNLFPLTLTALKAINTSGTWSGNVYTYGNVSYTVNNTDDIVTSIETSGTCNNSYAFFYLAKGLTVKSGKTYSVSGSPVGKAPNTYRIFTDSNSAFPAGNRLSDDRTTDQTRTAMGNENIDIFIQIFAGQNMNDKSFYPMLELGSDISTFEKYNGTTETITFGQTVYGGRLNVGSGVLTITHAIKTFDGSESFGTLSGQRCVFNISGIKVNPVSQIDDLICSHYKSDVQGSIGDEFVYKTGENTAVVFRDTVHCVDVATFQAYLANQHSNGTPVQLVYWLATPTTIQLDSKQIQSIIGTNNIYADTGDIIDLKFILSVGKAIS